jgi:hypothetical protein
MGITDGTSILGVATENISLNGFGRITSYGVVRGITTNGTAFGETWADGDEIYYNPVTGNPTNIKPVAPNVKVSVGTLIKAGSGGSGSIQVEINHGSVLGGTDSNVQLTSVTNGNILTYDGGNGYWKNTDLTAGTGISVGTSVNGVLTVTNTSPSSGGTVTSVALTAPSIFTVTGSPVTTTGSLDLTYSGTALPILNGGTGQTTANAAFNALSPMTTIGDIIYGGASGVATRLAGNITTTAKFYTSTGTGTVAQAPILTTSTGTGSVVLATSPTLSGITVTGDISLNGSSTSQITIGISQTTTGAIDIGSLNGTGRLTLGYTTKTATTSIQGGATTTGLTKTINMGTGGLAGSTTTITIGSTAGTSTTTNNGTFTAIGGIAGGTF